MYFFFFEVQSKLSSQHVLARIHSRLILTFYDVGTLPWINIVMSRRLREVAVTTRHDTSKI
jgi:hypothetical protein